MHTPINLTRLLDRPDHTSPGVHSAEAMLLAGRALSQSALSATPAAMVILGIMRLSLVKLHAATLQQLSAAGVSVTVFGRADDQPAAMAGVEFCSLPADSPLCETWFVLVNGPTRTGALLGQAERDPADPTGRRVLFRGGLSASREVVERALLLLHLHAQLALVRQTPDQIASAEAWQRLNTELATSPHAARLGLQTLRLDQDLADPPSITVPLLNRPLALVAGPERESDTHAAQQLADALDRDGFRVNLLGIGVPGDVIIETARQLRPSALALCASSPQSIADLAELLPDLSELARQGCRIVLTDAGHVHPGLAAISQPARTITRKV